MTKIDDIRHVVSTRLEGCSILWVVCLLYHDRVSFWIAKNKGEGPFKQDFPWVGGFNMEENFFFFFFFLIFFLWGGNRGCLGHTFAPLPNSRKVFQWVFG